MLIVSRFGLVQKNLLKCSSLWGSLILFFLDVKFQILSGKIKCGRIPVSFPHLSALVNLWFFRLQG